MNVAQRQAKWFLLPWVVGFVVLTALPMLASLGISLVRIGPALSPGDWNWVGIEHYRNALGVDGAYLITGSDPWYWHLLGGKPNDPQLYHALCNSLFYTVLAVPLGLCTSLATALLLNRSMRGMSLLRAMVYLPHVMGGVATIVIWSWLFNPQFGWINQVIRFVYAVLDPLVAFFVEGGTADWSAPRWLYSPTGCKPAVIVIYLWTMGGSMLIFLAALRRVPAELDNAARMDGASGWRRFRYITLPLITPAILFNLVLGMVFAMQSFNEAYLLQNRQQADGLLFYVLYLYQVAFEPPYQLGYASALGWILFAVLFALVAPLLWSAPRWVHYASEGRYR